MTPHLQSGCCLQDISQLLIFHLAHKRLDCIPTAKMTEYKVASMRRIGTHASSDNMATPDHSKGADGSDERSKTPVWHELCCCTDADSTAVFWIRKFCQFSPYVLSSCLQQVAIFSWRLRPNKTPDCSLDSSNVSMCPCDWN